MHLEAMIEGVWKCTWRPYSSEYGDVLGGDDLTNWEGVIQQGWRYTVEAMIEQDWRST
jgi:hypothetical protein